MFLTNLRHINLPPFNAANGTPQIPTCTSPSDHAINVPSTLDDTAMTISSGTLVNETTGVGDDIKMEDDDTKGMDDDIIIKKVDDVPTTRVKGWVMILMGQVI